LTSTHGDPLVLHEDRFFDSDPAIRRAARELYDGIRALPIVSPHGHVDPRLLATDEPFPEPTALLITPDHYVIRMLYSQGIPMEALGIATHDGSPFESDPRAIWQRFADHWHLFRGTPSGVWLTHVMYEVFGVRTKLAADSASAIYDEIDEKLKSPEFRPRALYERFNIEVLATTDGAADSLVHHRAMRVSGWKGKVIPTFRPDAVFQIASGGWLESIEALGMASGTPIGDYDDFTSALVERREHFKSLGATATDHGVTEPFTERLVHEDASRLFERAKTGHANMHDQHAFKGHMLMEMARMSLEDGLVMQLHAGAVRDHNGSVANKFGHDAGGDIPTATEFTRNLRPLLEAYGNESDFTLIVFTLDESTYSRELAPLAGHYPAMRLGPPWWFHDSIEGMRRYREQVMETAGIYNTAGFNDDTRAFCSIPARHDLARRMDANWLGGLVARHVVDMSDAREMAHALAYDLAKSAYKLDDA
jgi:glucuronate isomerase